MNGHVKTNPTSLSYLVKDNRLQDAEDILNSFLFWFTLSISFGSRLNLLNLPWDYIIKWVPQYLIEAEIHIASQ
jgi:hypothetical protein